MIIKVFESVGRKKVCVDTLLLVIVVMDDGHVGCGHESGGHVGDDHLEVASFVT